MKRAVEEAIAPSKKHKHKHDTGHKHSSSVEQAHNGHTGESRHKSSSRSHDSLHGGNAYNQPHQSSKYKNDTGEGSANPTSYAAALDQLPPAVSKSSEVPAYTPFTVTSGLPTLPAIKSPSLANGPFRHKSVLASYDRNSTGADISYERLEFLGDAYIELIASRLISERFSFLAAGQQSQLRELLVKNETLAEYSRAYKFDERVETGSIDKMLKDVGDRRDKWQGNKGWTKILGDVFEAYVAAVILADAEHGFSVAEKWLTAIWAPKLAREAAQNTIHGPSIAVNLTHASNADARRIYNPTAKQELQKRILGHSGTKLEYLPYKDSVELKGDQLGQNKHFIALYLTGYGYEKKLLGKGEGKNKVEAGNWAAVEAMHGECQGIVEECEVKLKDERERRKAERAAED